MNRSQTLANRYLWAVGPTAAQMFLQNHASSDRYQIVASQIWLDTQPELPPELPNPPPAAALPYLHLYPYRLHVPSLYDFFQDPKTQQEILLLENVPLTETGELQPPIAEAWEQASAVRQVYWLWQILSLWQPCVQLDVATSLLTPENLRVEGWRVRLRELIDQETPPSAQARSAATLDAETDAVPPPVRPSLAELAQCWLIWLPEAKPAIVASLRTICVEMTTPGASYERIASHLNQLLLEQAASLPLQLRVFGGTEVGAQRSHNEDTCYPLTAQRTPAYDDLMPKLTIVCDGIGGHEGGEVASQLAIQSLQLQIKALLTEIAGQSEPLPPDVISEELMAVVRVVNNMIADRNDAQNRESRRRMGTTLVMALQIPQRVKLPSGAISSNAHELYIVNVGDSRAYWITPQYCHQLTVDDDVAVREVRMGRSTYRAALQRSDAGALTQALGTKDSKSLYPAVQRFILEEDGCLLLCSDGLSDYDLVERSWPEYAQRILVEQGTLDTIGPAWLAFANQQNGHDNLSMVLTQCQISSLLPELPPNFDPEPVAFSPDEVDAEPRQFVPSVADRPARPRPTQTWLRSVLVFILSGVLGWGAWYFVSPAKIKQLPEQITKMFFKR